MSKRTRRRKPLQGKAQIDIQDKTSILVIHDLAYEGLTGCSNHFMPTPGENCFLTFLIPYLKNTHEVKIKARIVYCKHSAELSCFRTGFHFNDIDENVADLIECYMDAVSEPPAADLPPH